MSTTVPYFYIIRHISSGQLYAGCKYARGCNPNTFMIKDGYLTSSKEVNRLIVLGGINSFEIIQLLTEDICGIDVYSYETRFLQSNKISQRDNWLNRHNNSGVFPVLTTEETALKTAKQKETIRNRTAEKVAQIAESCQKRQLVRSEDPDYIAFLSRATKQYWENMTNIEYDALISARIAMWAAKTDTEMLIINSNRSKGHVSRAANMSNIERATDTQRRSTNTTSYWDNLRASPSGTKHTQEQLANGRATRIANIEAGRPNNNNSTHSQERKAAYALTRAANKIAAELAGIPFGQRRQKWTPEQLAQGRQTRAANKLVKIEDK